MSVPKSERFLKFPIERSLRWEERSFYERLLSQALYFEFQERTVQIGADWKRAVCARLHVPGRERPPVLRALDELAAVGLLVVGDGTFRLVYTDAAPPAPHRPHNDNTSTPRVLHEVGTSTVERLHNDGTSTSLSDLSAGEHSGPSGEIDREIEEKDTQNTGVRACERVEPVTVEDPVSYFAAVQLRFRKLTMDAGKGDPSMGGREVGRFPEQLANTAAGLGVEPISLLERTHAQWVAESCPGLDKSSPFAAFVARFNRYAIQPVRDVKKGFVRSSSPESFEGGTDGDEVFGTAPVTKKVGAK